MRQVGISELRANFATHLVNVELNDESVAITVRGKPVAVLLSAKEYHALQESIRAQPADQPDPEGP